MKIQLFFIDYYNKNSSGLSTYVGQLTDCFLNQSQINLSYININTKLRPEVEKEVIDDIVHYQYPKELQISDIDLNSSLIHLLKSNIVADLPVIFHFNWINHAPFAQVLKKNFECITLLTKHCIPWRDHIVGNYNLFNRLNANFLSDYKEHFIDQALHREYISYTSVDHIICVTDFAKSALIKMFGLHDEKLTVVYNGLKVIDPPIKEKDDLKVDYGFPISDKIVLFAGNVNIRKGVVDLVESFKLLLEKIPNVRLVIAGKGDYESVVNAAGNIWSKITITGNLDKKTLFDFYHMADVGVVPSYIEQCSYTAIEMMHSGLPIIVTNVDGLAEIVPRNGGLKVPLLFNENQAKVDVMELKDTIYRLLENPDYSYKFAKIAKVHAVERLKSEVMANETLKVYRHLADETLKSKHQTSDNSETLGKVVIMVCFDINLDDYRLIVSNIFEQNYVDFEIIFFIAETNFNLFMPEIEKENAKVRFLTFPKRQSIVRSLNEVIKDCRGEFISIITKKAMVQVDRFERQIDILLSETKLDFVGSNCFMLDGAGNRNGIKQFPLLSEDCSVLNLFQNTFELTNVLFRAAVLKTIKFKSFGSRIDEAKFWFELLRKHSGINLDEYLTSIYMGKLPTVKSSNIIKNHIGEIIQDQLDYYKIEYEVKELALHLAIYLGYKKLYFNDYTKNEHLTNWLHRLFSKLEIDHKIDKLRLSTYIKRFLCDVA